MGNRVDEIRKRIAKRRKKMQQHRQIQHSMYVSDEETYGYPAVYSSDDSGSWNHPLFRKEIFLFQLFASIILFLVVGIIFKSNGDQFETAKAFVETTFEREFQFAIVANWYEEQFGQPLAILPISDESKLYVAEDNKNQPEQIYAVPAAGTVKESFRANGSGIMVETGIGSAIEAVDEGFVVFAGVKDGIGKTVIIQHPNDSETWYGSLETIDVQLYDFVEARTKIGKAKTIEENNAGIFYFAIKKGDSFVDPSQVISFD